MRASRTKRQRQAPPSLAARLSGHVTLQIQPDGEIAAGFYGQSVTLGALSARAATCAESLRVGLPLDAFGLGKTDTDQEIALLVRRLARLGLLEY
ncbi:MAG: dehydrogenase, partial [Xanthobacteraceae bacterium]